MDDIKVCKFCGQTILDGRECDCPVAMLQNEKNEAYTKATSEAKELIKEWNEDMFSIVRQSIQEIIFNDLKSVTIEDDYGIRLKLSKVAKGFIKLDRTETNKSSISI